VRGGRPELLWQEFERAGAAVSTDGRALLVAGLSPEDVGDIALHARVPIYELVSEAPGLEQIFLNLTGPR
jgi:ABC-2 type transport system ATP-binding protein